MKVRALADGGTFAELHGAGPLVAVLCHGWGRNRQDLSALADAVASRSGGTVAALDLPGFGAAPEPAQPIGSAGYADLVAEALRELATTSGTGTAPVLFGHSFGGRVALCCAAAHPHLMSGLVLAGVPLLRTDGAARRRPPMPFRWARWLRRRGLLSERRMEALRQRYGSADYRAASGVMRQILVRVIAEDYTAELTRLTCPVSFVWGDDDSAAPLDQARRAAGLVKDLRHFDHFEGVGHDVHHLRTEEVAGAIVELVPAGGHL